MLEKETQEHIRLENLLRMLSESSFIESSIFDLESGFSIVESEFLKRESEHESGFFPSPDFLRVRVQVRVRVRSGFRSMPLETCTRLDNQTCKRAHVLITRQYLFKKSKSKLYRMEVFTTSHRPIIHAN